MLPSWLTDTITSDIDRALHYTLLWGLEGVELRTVGRTKERVPHVNEAKLRRRLEEAEIPVVAIVPGIFEGFAEDRVMWLNEIAAFGETLQFCNRIGCPIVVVSAFQVGDMRSTGLAVEAFRKAGDAALRKGTHLAVLNSIDTIFSTGEKLGDLLDQVAHPAVGAAWSPATALQMGEDPLKGLGALGNRILLVRCFDGKRSDPGLIPFPLGDGDVGWRQQIRKLYELGFTGPLSLEVKLDPRPKQGLRDATSLIQLIRDVAREPR